MMEFKELVISQTDNLDDYAENQDYEYIALIHSLLNLCSIYRTAVILNNAQFLETLKTYFEERDCLDVIKKVDTLSIEAVKAFNQKVFSLLQEVELLVETKVNLTNLYYHKGKVYNGECFTITVKEPEDLRDATLSKDQEISRLQEIQFAIVYNYLSSLYAKEVALFKASLPPEEVAVSSLPDVAMANIEDNMPAPERKETFTGWFAEDDGLNSYYRVMRPYCRKEPLTPGEERLYQITTEGLRDIVNAFGLNTKVF